MIDEEICLSEDMTTFPASSIDFDMRTNCASAIEEARELTEEEKEKIRIEIEKNFHSNPYPEYINLPWGE